MCSLEQNQTEADLGSAVVLEAQSRASPEGASRGTVTHEAMERRRRNYLRNIVEKWLNYTSDSDTRSGMTMLANERARGQTTVVAHN